MKQSWQTEDVLIEDIWEGKVDQMSTREIAEKYQISQQIALRILKKVASGYKDKYPYNKRPFEYDEERQGVKISDGSLFTFSPMDIDGGGMSKKRPKHYIWFCS